MAILDLTIEKTTAGGPPTSLTTRELAEEIVELYWPHASPYEPVRRVLRQGGGHADHQAEIVRAIARFRQEVAGAPEELQHRARLAQPRKYEQLVRFVEWKLIEMPIPRLQVMGRDEDRFLYEYSWDQSIKRAHGLGLPGRHARSLRQPALAEARRGGAPGQAEWRSPAHRPAGVGRHGGQHERPARDDPGEVPVRRRPYPPGRGPPASPGASVEPLLLLRRPHQREPASVDHFIPWARYPDNGLDNLVAAHDRCNNNKRDFLAAAEHLERWRQRTRDHDDLLSALAVRLRWERNSDRSRGVASALYGRLPAGARLWRVGSDFEVADPERLVLALSA